ncbi:MAG: hypothetical protein JWO38_5025 [Gemmataceae bacterium]|nr:hypothetical protein [Gemmataceae bacterium]
MAGGGQVCPDGGAFVLDSPEELRGLFGTGHWPDSRSSPRATCADQLLNRDRKPAPCPGRPGVGPRRQLGRCKPRTLAPRVDHLPARNGPAGRDPARPVFRSWVLLFGLIPIDYDDFTLVELDPGRGFLEDSRLFSMSEWRHRRTVSPLGSGSLVRDEVSFVPRWPLTGPLLAAAYRLAFEYRHRTLRRLFGVARPGHD